MLRSFRVLFLLLLALSLPLLLQLHENFLPIEVFVVLGEILFQLLVNLLLVLAEPLVLGLLGLGLIALTALTTQVSVMLGEVLLQLVVHGLRISPLGFLLLGLLLLLCLGFSALASSP